ncbi:chorismate-binding protein [Methylacidiphilum caldifontis]|uniref:Metal ABC transporter ATP-binding protein n=1 Tax=Methylacidiphilum caldifontis TaxID=2795386 RepID=A0A4Y8PCU5_9BACT|nr:anthranilate synthase component I family protein [Methylacidiphilum caldifontis]QSR87894.1 anthranilate synthase component I family protein [Methylacidiphilum caldifontis]TFE68919.1 metal ABC transporter ATP-binding protein [Methylacidiphilum caldifontis]
MVVVPTWNKYKGFYYGQKPIFSIHGNSTDWGGVKSFLGELQNAEKNSGLVGHVDFEGNFWFGFYPQLLFFKDRLELLGFLRTKLKSQPKFSVPFSFISHTDKQEYASMVLRAKDYISSGDIYVINLARKIELPWQGDPLSLLVFFLEEGEGLEGICYIDDGPKTLVCASPELFLSIEGTKLISKPIKGTRPRCNRKDPANSKNLVDLIKSEKEKAELLMITDLVRNDFGKVCVYGSVKVSQLRRVTMHPHLYHMHSKIEGIISPHYDSIDAFLANFPGGSVTGTPKKRAIELIKELENLPRRNYSGAIGYFKAEKAAFTMAIRLVEIEGQRASFHVGSGITFDSDPYAEYEETEQKAIFIKTALENCLK